MRREIIRIAPVRCMMLDNAVVYVKIINFQKSTYREVRRGLRRLLERSNPAHLRGIVLDLRDNPGGLFDQAIRTADLFLDRGVITRLRGRSEGMSRKYEAERGGLLTSLPVVVLINKGTASAAEILAGALKGKPGAILMGGTSFGKASVQGVFPIRRKTALRLTTAHYYTADGADINGRGIAPDIGLPDSEIPAIQGQIYSVKKETIRSDPWILKARARVAGIPGTTRLPFETLF